MISAIAHPTDFSPEGRMAFLHALRLALINRCRLDLLHVRAAGDDEHWERFPRVRDVLVGWGLLAPGASIQDIAARTGVDVRKIDVRDADPVDGLSHFLATHQCDLIVMATHGRHGLNRWLRGSISADVAQQAHVPSLLFGPAAQPLADAGTSIIERTNVLVPVAREPSPRRVLQTLSSLMSDQLDQLDLVHIGTDPPTVRDGDGNPVPVRLIDGAVAEAILAAADACRAGLIVMPTAGRHGFLDAVRGSTTEQVVARASCPVLALPA